MSKIITQIIGLIVQDVKQYDDTILMTFSDGQTAEWYHDQDCCESVGIEDVIGDWSDLYGHPLLVAEERTSHDEFLTSEQTSWDNSHTWTFYSFRNLGGSVDVRWHGESNGYYSESVDMKFNGERVNV